MLRLFYQSIRAHRFQLLCILPLAAFLFFFTFIPIVRLLILSFQQPHVPGLSLANFRELFSQKQFLLAFFNTVFIALVSLGLEISFGLILALAVSKNYKLIRYTRAIFILPLAIPTVVVGVVMSYIFSSSGWLNRILLDTGLIHQPVYWMSGGIRSLLMVSFADTWKVTPLVMLILVAGLQSIDKSLYKAASIDGAGAWYIFRRVTLPLLMPSITACVIIRGIDAFRIFALPLILMGQNLKVLGTYAYLEYTEFNNPYISAASACILLGLILFAAAVYVKAVGRKGLAAA
ncbi:MAG: sugar ABC transporter permease [Candidatus Omnitrophota bacterium]